MPSTGVRQRGRVCWHMERTWHADHRQRRHRHMDHGQRASQISTAIDYGWPSHGRRGRQHDPGDRRWGTTDVPPGRGQRARPHPTRRRPELVSRRHQMPQLAPAMTLRHHGMSARSPVNGSLPGRIRRRAHLGVGSEPRRPELHVPQWTVTDDAAETTVTDWCSTSSQDQERPLWTAPGPPNRSVTSWSATASTARRSTPCSRPRTFDDQERITGTSDERTLRTGNRQRPPPSPRPRPDRGRSPCATAPRRLPRPLQPPPA